MSKIANTVTVLALLSAVISLALGSTGVLSINTITISDTWIAILASMFWITLFLGLVWPLVTILLDIKARQQNPSARKRRIIAFVALVSALSQTGIGWTFVLSNYPNGWFLHPITAILMVIMAVLVLEAQPPTYDSCQED